MTAGERCVPDTPIYKVFLLNDDYTPMEFVVHVLERIFDLDRKDAEQLTHRVHNDGIAQCLPARGRREKAHGSSRHGARAPAPAAMPYGEAKPLSGN
jgi:ATP-dependent Clp protease adapter protein ClpS